MDLHLNNSSIFFALSDATLHGHRDYDLFLPYLPNAIHGVAGPCYCFICQPEIPEDILAAPGVPLTQREKRRSTGSLVRIGQLCRPPECHVPPRLEKCVFVLKQQRGILSCVQ
jgi:hypothetical protein